MPSTDDVTVACAHPLRRAVPLCAIANVADACPCVRVLAFLPVVVLLLGSHPYSVMQISTGAAPVTLVAQFQRRWSGLVPLAFTLACLVFQLVTASKETDAAMLPINLQPAVLQALCYITAALAGISIFVGLFFVADTTGERSYVGSCCTGGVALFFAFAVAVVASLTVHYWNQSAKFICDKWQPCQDAKAGMIFAWISFCAALLAEVAWCVVNKRAVINARAPGKYIQRAP